ncbi:MAG TPA: hypothetical protein VFK05_08350 [Polyangiaceae bacterium]|nr:hypothetical protein [Polyangiaceae bacterium]
MDHGNLGFDFDAVRAAIADRFVSSGPCAVIGERPKMHVAHALMDEHRLKHGGPVVGVSRCPIWPCTAAGLAFAELELELYLISATYREEAAFLEEAATHSSLWETAREECRTKAAKRRESLFSRPLEMTRTRRPPAALAQALTQHLRSGGFTYPEIAELMGCSCDCAKKRGAAWDIRTVVAYDNIEPSGAA